MDPSPREVVYRLEITGDLDRRTAEALRLEIRRLARCHGLDIGALRLTKAEEVPPPPSD